MEMNSGKLVLATFLAAGLAATAWAMALVVMRAEYNLNWFALGGFLLLGAGLYRRHLRTRRRHQG